MKRRFLAALAASAMIFALSAPAALGQAIVGDDGDDGNLNIQYVDCSQVQSAFASQVQGGDANAAADDESEANSEIAQDLGITQEQVNQCLGGAANNTPAPDETTDETTTGSRDLEEGKDAVIEDTVKAAALPDTGGSSLLLVGGGILLVASGAALIRRR